MRAKLFAIAVPVLFVALGCGGAANLATFKVRTINLVRGAATINVNADTGSLASALAYGTTTSFGSLDSISQAVNVTDASTGAALVAAYVTPQAGSESTLYVTGAEGGTPAPSISLISEVIPTTSTTAANVRFGNFSTALQESVDVYVWAPTVSVPTSPTFPGIAYGSIGSYILLTGGSYNVRVTPSGNSSTILASGTLTVSNGADYSILETDASSTTAALVSIQDSY